MAALAFASPSPDPQPPVDLTFARAERAYSPRTIEKLLALLAEPETLPPPRLWEDLGLALPPIYARRPMHEDEHGQHVQRSRPKANPLEEWMGFTGRVLAEIERLGPLPRQVVEVCLISGLTFREFGERHGLSTSTVWRVKQQAVEELAYRLGWRPEPQEDPD